MPSALAVMAIGLNPRSSTTRLPTTGAGPGVGHDLVIFDLRNHGARPPTSRCK